MGRPTRLNPDQEKDLKCWLLNGIEANGNHDAYSLSQFMSDSNLNPQQINYYMAKFHLSFKPPYAFNEDLAEYYIWWDEQEAKGSWLGDKTTLQAIIENEAELDKAIKAGRVNPSNVVMSPGEPIPGKFYSFRVMIEAAKRNPRIKTLGDWDLMNKPSKIPSDE